MNTDRTPIHQELVDWLTTGREPILTITGGAGTGKTTLIKRIVEHAAQSKKSVRLVAPTGRAARIIEERTGHVANTIHQAIYTYGSTEMREHHGVLRVSNRFPLRGDGPDASLIVIDEASMVGDTDQGGEELVFGSGRLLTDLLQWSRVGTSGVRLVFVGDAAQLPPVGETVSPVFSADGPLARFGSKTLQLTQVHRQDASGSIYQLGAQMRARILGGRYDGGEPALNGEVYRTSAADLIHDVVADPERTVVLSYTNRAALQHNRAIRERRWGPGLDGPVVNDRLLVVKNSRTGLMNGDVVDLTDLGRREQRTIYLKNQAPVRLSFRMARLTQGDQDTVAMILENRLDSDARSVSGVLSQALLVDFEQRCAHSRGSQQYLDAMVSDPYLNALHVKYAYAMTCHKAQGGEWDHVIVDLGGLRPLPTNWRWLYTAVTRARVRLGVLGALPSGFYVRGMCSLPMREALAS